MHYYTATKAVMLNYWNFINQVKKDKEMHCFTATKPIGPTSPVFRCFCEAESEIVVFRVADRCSSTKTQKIIYLLLYRCVSLQRKSETHCFTATKAIGPTSPVVRCFCEAESQIVVFRVADQCSSTKTQKIIYLLLYTDAFLSNERVKSIVFHPLKRSDRHDPWSDVVLKLNPKLLCFGLLIGGLAPKPKNLHIFCCTDAFLSKERVKRIVFQPLK